MKRNLLCLLFICLICFFLISGCDDPQANLWLKLLENDLYLSPLETFDLSAIGPEEIEEESSIIWKSTDSSIVTVDQTGKVTALQEGQATISATLKEDSTISASCTIQVELSQLILDTKSEGDTSVSNTIWYCFTAAAGCDYIIEWEDSHNSSYSGEILLSAYHGDRSSAYFERSATGTHSITSENCEPVFIKVEASGALGKFSIKYDFSGNSSTPWTLLIYMNCDNLEESCMANLKEMLSAYHDQMKTNVLILIDKISIADYDIDGLDFSGTALFSLEPGRLNKIWGGLEFKDDDLRSYSELNMGDAKNLGKFIRFSKNNFPAEKTGLIFIAHGEAAGGFSSDDNVDNDRLHPGELQEELKAEDSIDLLGFNSCLMGSAEVAYEFRADAGNTGFKADIMVAPPGTTNEIGWRYDWVFQRINESSGGAITGETETITGGYEEIYSPSTMTALELGRILVEEQLDGMYAYSPTQFFPADSLNCFDLSEISQVKTNLDSMSSSLFINNEKDALENLRDDKSQTIVYFRSNLPTVERQAHELTYYPFYDLKSLCEAVVANTNIFSAGTRAEAADVVLAINDVIKYSYFGNYSLEPNFYDNMYGLSIFFPHGNELYLGKEMFSYQWWYNANNMLHVPSDEKYYGELAWCIDSSSAGNSQVDNWFELLDAWYDDPVQNPVNGGYNEFTY